jgi:dUTP pyrophosphatase
MRIAQLHKDLIMPNKGSQYAGAIDLYMPEAGYCDGNSRLFGLGFAAAVPNGHVALLVPRSSTGAKFGLELNNTVGVIDEDYRGEWMVKLRTKDGSTYTWNAGDRLVQAVIVPVWQGELKLVDSVEALGATERGFGGFGSIGT